MLVTPGRTQGRCAVPFLAVGLAPRIPPVGGCRPVGRCICLGQKARMASLSRLACGQGTVQRQPVSRCGPCDPFRPTGQLPGR